MILRQLLQSFGTNLAKVGPASAVVRSVRVLQRGLKPSPELRNVLASPTARQHQKFSSLNDVFFAISDRHYLCQTLTMPERLQSADYHYRFVDTQFDPAVIGVLGATGFPLWTANVNDHDFTIRLMYGNDNMYEGGLSAVFFVDNQRVGVMSFSIIEGAMFNLAPGPTVILCRNQTTSDRWYQKPLQDAFKQIALPYLMISAVAGIGRCLGQNHFLAVHEEAHPALKDTSASVMRRSYSEFWEKYGAVPLRDGLVKIALPLESTPLDQVSSNHRRRAKARRELMAQVSDVTAETLRNQLKFAQPFTQADNENVAGANPESTEGAALRAVPSYLQLALASSHVIRSLISG
jgi:uncharacterized protein VirK/YbjX